MNHAADSSMTSEQHQSTVVTGTLARLILLVPPLARVVSSKAAGLLGSPPPKGPVVMLVGKVTRRVVDARGEQAAGTEEALTVRVAQKREQVPS